MSQETWMKEFYPVPAHDIPKNKAIKHSLVKWYGLRKESLEKHGLNAPPIDVDDQSCALCQRYNYGPRYFCKNCPLAEYLGRPCASWTKKHEFEAYEIKGNPEPMIAALEAIEFVERTCK